MDAMLAEHDPEARAGLPGDTLTQLEADFTVQIATAVWLCRLSEDAALEALTSYAIASQRSRREQIRLRIALLSEYRRCRERQDICS